MTEAHHKKPFVTRPLTWRGTCRCPDSCVHPCGNRSGLGEHEPDHRCYEHGCIHLSDAPVVEPEQPTCGIAGCEGEHHPQDHNDAVRHTTTNAATLSDVLAFEAGQMDERARIRRMIEPELAKANTLGAVVMVNAYMALLAAIDGGNEPEWTGTRKAVR